MKATESCQDQENNKAYKPWPSSQVARHTWSWTHDWADAGLLSCRCRSSSGPIDAKQGINPSSGRYSSGWWVCWCGTSIGPKMQKRAWSHHWADAGLMTLPTASWCLTSIGPIKESKASTHHRADAGLLSLPMWSRGRNNIGPWCKTWWPEVGYPHWADMSVSAWRHLPDIGLNGIC